VANGVNPAMKEVETAGAEAALDRVFAHAERHELPAGNDAVLPSGESRDSPVRVT
jgi:hypothetical protein